MSQDYVGARTAQSGAQRPAERRNTPVWTERMVKALEARATSGWYSLMDKVVRQQTLEQGWKRVKANGGAAGVDRISIQRFQAQLEREIPRLSEQLKTERYRPQAVRRVEIPKADGGMRGLGIPTVRDRIVQAAVLTVIEPIFEHRFEERSYGFRPGRGCKDALRDVQQALDSGLLHIVDADLKSYFDTIPHAPLMAQIHHCIKDGAVLRLIEKFLEQDVVSQAARWSPETGTPQGAVLSPLLANIYLHPLDTLMREAGFRMVRYADDFVVLCQTAEQAQKALETIRVWVASAGLCLHPEKTRLTDLSQAGGYFDFLGYRFQHATGKGTGRTIRPKKLKAIRAQIKALTPRRNGRSTTELVERLNATLRGVFGYFKHAPRRDLATLDAHVRYRLRRIFAKRRGMDGCAKRWKAHRLWPNRYFDELGLFSMAAARDAFLHSHARPT